MSTVRRTRLANGAWGELVILLCLGLFCSIQTSAQVREINPDRSDLDASGNPDPANLQGPEPDGSSGGRVNHLVRSPGSNLIYYAASEWGGLFKTIDAGRNWTRLDGHLPVATWDVAVDPFNPQRLYATSFYDGRMTPRSGIQTSDDAGATWVRPASATPPAGYNCGADRIAEPSAFGIAVRPDSPRNVFVGTNCGVAVSNDFGATWRFVDPSPANPATDVWDVLVQPGGRLGRGIVDVCGDDGHFRSIDGGATWTPGGPVPVGPGVPCALAASPDENYVIYLAAADFNLYESDDGGATWNPLGNPAPQGRVPFVVTNQRSTTGGVNRFDLWFGDVRLHRAGCTTPDPPQPGGSTRCPTAAMWAGPFTRTAGAHDDSGDLAFDSGNPVIPAVLPTIPVFSTQAPDVVAPPATSACEASALLGPPGTGLGCGRTAPAPDLRLNTASLGLDSSGPFTDDLDALSFGGPPRPGIPSLQFSVDRNSRGFPCGLNDVNSEAARGEAHGDVFVGVVPCGRRFRDERELGLSAPGVPVDNLDALADEPALAGCLAGADCKTFSVSRGSAIVGRLDPRGNQISPADLLVAPGAPNCPPGGLPCVAVAGSALGLDRNGPGDDDVDAVCWLDANGNRTPDPPGGMDLYFFSLAPGSAQLATFSAADILTVGPNGLQIAMPAAALGLRREDNLDALECSAPPQPTICVDACPSLFSSDGGVYYNTRNATTIPDCQTPAWEQPDVTPHALWVFTLDGAERPGNDEEDLYFGNQDNGTFATLNAGASPPTWSNKDCCDSFDSPADNNRILYTLCCFGGQTRLFRRNPGMVGGQRVNGPPGGLLGFHPLPTIATFGPSQAVTLTTTGVYATANVGGNPIAWTQVGVNPPPNACSVQVALARGEPFVYVLAGRDALGRLGCDGGNAGTTGQLWRHRGLGAGGMWTRVDTGLTRVGVFSVDPLDPMRLYASDLTPATPRMVFSEDGGATWRPDPDLDRLMTQGGAVRYQTQRGPTDFTLFGGYAQPSLLARNPEDSSCIVAGGRDSGLFASNDGGRNWSVVTAGAPIVPRPWNTYFDNETNQVFVGTQGRGVWRFPLSCPADFGDAEPSYPTRPSDNGARHASTRHEWLGKPTVEHDRSVSEEFSPEDRSDPDGVPNLPGGPEGFDVDRFDDGVVFYPRTYASGGRGKLRFNVCVDSLGDRYSPLDPDRVLYLNAWIDWDTNRRWEETNLEHIIDGLRLAPVNPGAWAPLGMRSPSATITQIGTSIDGRCGLFEAEFPVGQVGKKTLWARFRLDYGEDVGRNDPRPLFQSDKSLRDPSLAMGAPQPVGRGVGYTQGQARYGEVEDYRVGGDFGDAPDRQGAYPTRAGSDGARHLDIYKEWLGREKTRETNACPEGGPTEDQDGSFNLGGSCNASNLDRAEESLATLDLATRSIVVSFTARSTISVRGYDLMGVDDDGDGRRDEDPANDGLDEDFDSADGEDGPDQVSVNSLDPADPLCRQRPFQVWSTPPWSGGKGRYFSTEVDDDRDGRMNEDPINGSDDDNDGSVDEDPPGVRPLFANIFIDWNADGDWDDAGEHVLQDALIAPETFGPDGSYTLGEPFVDSNQNGAFDAGESFTDSAGVDQQSYTCRFKIPEGVSPIGSRWVRVRLSYAEKASQTLDELIDAGVAHSQEDSRMLDREKGGALFGEVEDRPVRFFPYKFSLPPRVYPPETVRYQIVASAAEELQETADGWIEDQLPEGVQFAGALRCEPGQCRFDPATRTVRWEGVWMPDGSVSLEFDVTVPREFPPYIPTIYNRVRIFDGLKTITATGKTDVRRTRSKALRLDVQGQFLWQERRLEEPFPIREIRVDEELPPGAGFVVGLRERVRLDLYTARLVWAVAPRWEIHGRLGVGLLKSRLDSFAGATDLDGTTTPTGPFPFRESIRGTGSAGPAFGAGLTFQLHGGDQHSLAVGASWTQLRNSDVWSVDDLLNPEGDPISVEGSRSDYLESRLEIRFGKGRLQPYAGVGAGWLRTRYRATFPALGGRRRFQFVTSPKRLPVFATGGLRYGLQGPISLFAEGQAGSQSSFGVNGGLSFEF